jgi:hypothetical protein
MADMSNEDENPSGGCRCVRATVLLQQCCGPECPTQGAQIYRPVSDPPARWYCASPGWGRCDENSPGGTFGHRGCGFPEEIR